MGTKNTDTAAEAVPKNTTTAAEEPTARFKVLVPELLVGAVRAYQGGTLKLTQKRADEINAFQPGSLELAGF